jgi:hypothetical protein
MRIFRPSNAKRLFFLFGSLVFVVSGVWMLMQGNHMMWFPIIFFGFCSIVYALTFHPRSTFLKIEDDGFTMVSFFSPSKYKWEDVDTFRIGLFNRRKVILFDRFNRDASESVFAWQEDMLPHGIGFSASGLAQILQEEKNKTRKTGEHSIKR